jgi:hypothetical protein
MVTIFNTAMIILGVTSGASAAVITKVTTSAAELVNNGKWWVVHSAK